MNEFLTRLDEGDREAFSALGERRRFAADEIIMKEGERLHAIFLIESGSARVERHHMEFYVEIARLGPGEILGEMSFVSDEAASASVVANEETEVLVFDGARIEALFESRPGFYGSFYRVVAEILARRLRETTAEGIAEFAWGGRPVDVDESERPDSDDTWGGGSPIRDFADEGAPNG